MGKWLDAARAIRAVMDKAGAYLTDEEAAQVQALYPAWDAQSTYSEGERVQYEEVLYKCLSAHTAQETWTPTDAPSLWAKVLVSDTGEALPWEQPDSTNAYMTGDKVTHGGKTWVCTVDNNVWEPGVYGWTEE